MNPFPEQSMAKILMATWPSQSGRHLRSIPPDPGQAKAIRLIHSTVTEQDLVGHLHPASRAGPGAIGVMPGIKSGVIWRTPWAMLDFDATTPIGLKPFLDLLVQHGLTLSFSFGTTGKGCHVWFLLDQAITLVQAHRTLNFLERVAISLGHSGIDLRPDDRAAEKEPGIMLPYRGAASDGAGANPLWDPVTGAQIPLAELPNFPRQNANAFAKLGTRQSVNRFLSGLIPRDRPTQTERVDSVLRSEEQWDVELDRLDRLWEQGRRHYLTLAATAYGLRLGINPDQVKRDLMELIKSNNDEEYADREKVIDLSLRRYDNGESLAFQEFYETADIEAPKKARLAVVQPLVWAGLKQLMNRPWSGQSGKTDRSVYKTLLSLAHAHGYDHPEGVEVSVAWSTLSLEANVGSDSTMSKSLARLQAADYIRRAAGSLAGKSGSFVLLLTECSTLSRGGAGGEESFGLSFTLRNGQHRLGKTKEELLDLLVWHGPQTLNSLAQRVGARPYDLKKHLSALSQQGLIEGNTTRPDSLFRTVEDLKERLEAQQTADGSTTAWSHQKARLNLKTRRYAEVLRRDGSEVA